MRQECAHNWSAVYDTFIQTEDAFYDVVSFNLRFEGFSGVKSLYEAIESTFPDFQITVWGENDVPGCSVREIAITATHKGAWCGFAGTGRPVKVHLGILYLFGVGEPAGKLLAERIYFDNESLMQQIRGE